MWTDTLVWIESFSDTGDTIVSGTSTGSTIVGTWDTFTRNFNITRGTLTVWEDSVFFTSVTTTWGTFKTFIIGWLTGLTFDMDTIIEETSWTVSTIWDVESRTSTDKTVIRSFFTF
jgi:hypothetical protein